MSPRDMMKNVGSGAASFMDLRDSDTKQFAYGKVWPIIIICCIIGFHAIGNPFDLGTAILLSATAVGPWMFVKFLERTSFAVQTSRSQLAGGGDVTTERMIQSKGAPPVPALAQVDPPVVGAVEPGD
jgi:hypothetical protein